MKTIKQLEKEIEEYEHLTQEEQISFFEKVQEQLNSEGNTDEYLKLLNETEQGNRREKLHSLKEVLVLISKDIEYQKTKLTGNFKKDKSIKWRIIGFEDLKKKIQEDSQ